jgi:hypothetical protein
VGIARSWFASPIWLDAVTVKGASYYIGLAALAVAMLWGAVIAYRSWEEAHEDLDPATRDELLEVFQQAHAEGELDASEFAKVRRRLNDGA